MYLLLSTSKSMHSCFTVVNFELLTTLKYGYLWIMDISKGFQVILPGERQCSDVLCSEEDLELSLQGLLDFHSHHTVHTQLG